MQAPPETSAFLPVNVWWNETFHYRIEVNVSEPGVAPRLNDPVSIWLSFSPGTCSNNSIRIVNYVATPSTWTEMPCQVWNNSYSGVFNSFIANATISFMVTIPQSSSALYFVYYTDIAVDNKTTTYQAQTGLVNSFDGSSAATLNNGKIALSISNQSDAYSLQLVGRSTNYATQYSLGPSSTRPQSIPSTYSTNTNGFVMNWMLIGPFTESGSGYWSNYQTYQNSGTGYNAQNFVGTTISYVAGDYASNATVTNYADPTQQWQAQISSDSTGLIDLQSLIGTSGDVAAYALIYVYSPTAQNGIYAKLGYNDGYALWVNGYQIYYNHVQHNTDSNDDVAYQVNLQQGWNRILVLIEDDPNQGSWNFRLRFSTDSNLRSVTISTNAIKNLTIAYAPIGFINAQASSPFTLLQSGPVFANYNYTLCNDQDLRVTDNLTFYQSIDMFKVTRTFWFTGSRVPGNNSFSLFNDFVPNPSNTFDEYIYDGQTVAGGLSNTTFQPSNYALVRDRTGDDFLTTTGDFITNVAKTNSSTIFSSLKWLVTYSGNTVGFMPGNVTNLLNMVGGTNNSFVVTFWKYLDQNFGQQGLDAASIANQIYLRLINPVITTIYSNNTESVFLNLNVALQDVDTNLAQGVNVTLINATSGSGWAPTYNGTAWVPSISSISGTNGIAQFFRLQLGYYTVNLTYAAYGHAPVDVNPLNVTWGAGNISLTTSQTVTYTNVALTHLTLNFQQFNSSSGQEIGPIIGGRVTCYTNWSSKAAELIANLTTDTNGYANFYWLNFTPDIANTTFTLTFLGSLQNINFSTNGAGFASNLSVPMANITSYRIDVQISAFGTSLVPSPTTFANTNFWGDHLSISVNYTYTLNAITYSIPSASVTYQLTFNGVPFNSSSFVEKGGGIYNLTLNSSDPWLNLNAGISYTLLVSAVKDGYTPSSVPITILLKNINATVTPLTPSIQANWNDNFVFQCQYLDTLHSFPLSGASLQYQVVSLPNIQGFLTDLGNGTYSASLNTSAFIYADTYTISITASKNNYQTNFTSIVLHIQNILTYIADWVNPNSQQISIQEFVNNYVTTPLLMSFNYTTATGIGIPNAAISQYEWQDQIGNKGTGLLIDQGTGNYSLDFNTATRALGTYTIVATIGQTNYVERVAVIFLNIVTIPGNGVVDNAVQTKTQRDNATFSFILTDGRANHTSELYPQAETAVFVNFASTSRFSQLYLFWSNGTNNGIFNLTISTASIIPGTYILNLVFSRANYTDILQSLTLVVNAFQPNVVLPTGLQNFLEGTKVNMRINVTDGLFSESFDAINITWTVTGTTLGGTITQVNPDGNYNITFPTDSLAAGSDYKLIITVLVVTDGESYSYTPMLVIDFHVDYPQILGIPQPYFWIVVVGIIAAIAIIPLVKFISYIHLPQVVRRMNDVHKIVKARKKVSPGEIPNNRIYGYLEKKYNYRWKAFNITNNSKLNSNRSFKEVDVDAQRNDSV